MKISKLEYVKMQVEISASLYARKNDPRKYCDSPESIKCMVDKILRFNGITVSDEPEVKPITVTEFENICDVTHEVGDGFEGIVEELKKRGLVKS